MSREEFRQEEEPVLENALNQAYRLFNYDIEDLDDGNVYLHYDACFDTLLALLDEEKVEDITRLLFALKHQSQSTGPSTQNELTNMMQYWTEDGQILDWEDSCLCLCAAILATEFENRYPEEVANRITLAASKKITLPPNC
jgi:hypothetical protein